MGDHLLGFLIVHVHKGVDLAVRDRHSSDPYVVMKMGSQKLKTRVVKKNLNPVWDQDLTFSVAAPLSVRVEVYDSDRLTPDDEMGYAEFDFTSFLIEARNAYDEHQINTVISSVKPTRTNCLGEESYITWTNGEVVQNMILRLRNVEKGEIEICLRWRELLGLLKVHVHKGVNLVNRDWLASNPYVIIRKGNQKLKTRFVRRNLNPIWDDEFTLFVADPLLVRLDVYHRNRFSVNKSMGDAEFDLKPFLQAIKNGLTTNPQNNVITTVHPKRTNCLAEESHITWTDGEFVQNMVLRLRNVEHGELEIKLRWVDVSSSREEFNGRLKGLKVDYVDTTGAGDAFVAGELSRLDAIVSFLNV